MEEFFPLSWFTVKQGRHGKFGPGKVQYSTPNFFDWLFLIRAYWFNITIETRNIGKAQALEALPAVAPLYIIN